MTSSAVEYKASPWGNKFHFMADENGRVIDEILGAGSSGPGKTTVLFRDPLFQMNREEARQHLPRSHDDWVPRGESQGHALLLRRGTPMLRDLISRGRPVFRAWNGGKEGWNSTDKTFTFQCGYQITLGHCYEVADVENYVGVSWTWIGFDELIQFEEEQYGVIKMWLRSADPILAKDLRVRAATNPVFMRQKGDDFTVSNPFWVRNYFVDPYPQGMRILREVKRWKGVDYERTRLYMPATIEDNPDPVYREEQKRKLVHAPRHLRKALLEGDWYYQPGGYFEHAWDPDIHVVKPYRIPMEWKLWRSMDWGFKTSGVVHWYAMDPDGNVVVIREYTFLGKTDEWVADRVLEIEKSMGLVYRKQSLLTGPADTQLWEDRGDTGMTKAARFISKGVHWVQAKKGRQACAEQVFKRLTDHNNFKSTPGLTVFSWCTETIKYAFSLPADSKEPNVPRKGGNDHHYDSISYGVRFAERGSLGIPDHQTTRSALERSGKPLDNNGIDGYGG